MNLPTQPDAAKAARLWDKISRYVDAEVTVTRAICGYGDLSAAQAARAPLMATAADAARRADDDERRYYAGLADIRAAVGDEEGRLMQDELAQRIRDHVSEYQRMCGWLLAIANARSASAETLREMADDCLLRGHPSPKNYFQESES